MKTFNNLYEQIYDFENLYNAYLKARRGKRDMPEVISFEHNLEENLIEIQNELIWQTFKTGHYRKFYVHEPKKRLAAALPFKDRVVQHAIISVIEPIFENRFIHHSYACRVGKGTHKGADVAQAWLRNEKAAHGAVYVLKADVSKYFASIDQGILIEILGRKITCYKTMQLIKGITLSWPHGLPIGNLTSQLLANVYLHELDVYCKQELKLKRYMRYMDDFIVVHHCKDFLHKTLRKIELFLSKELELKLNNKTQIFRVGAGNEGRALDFLGYRIWLTHRKIRKDSSKRMKKKLKRYSKLYSEGRIDFKIVNQSVISWVAHSKHANSYATRKSVLGGVVFTRSTA